MQSVAVRETAPAPSTRGSGVLSLEVLRVRHESGNCSVEHLQFLVPFSGQMDIEIIQDSIIPMVATHNLNNIGKSNNLEVRRNIRVLWVVLLGSAGWGDWIWFKK